MTPDKQAVTKALKDLIGNISDNVSSATIPFINALADALCPSELVDHQREKFSKQDTIDAVHSFLMYGESGFTEEAELIGNQHRGYYSGSGWAARVLRQHFEDLKKDESK